MIINMLNILKEMNPEIEFYSVFDDEFKTYGQIIDIDVSDLIQEAKKLDIPENVKYYPSMDTLEALTSSEKIKNDLFGTLPTQIGCCYGHSSFLNASEWHTASEINIAVTPLVLLLGHRWDIKDGSIDSSEFKAFYVPCGTVIECYATTLHYCPCQVSDDGFICIVALPKDTNIALETATEDKRIAAKNKWIICHKDNASAIARGILPGITGENYKIKYRAL